MSDLAVIVSGAIGCFGIGWAIGRFIKAIRQLTDFI